MSTDSSNRNTTLLAFLAGAAVGALAVALTTPKSGAQAREDLAGLGRRLKGKVGQFAQRGTRAWEGLQEPARDPHPASGQDLRGQAAGAYQDIKDGADRLAAEVKQIPAEVAKELSE